MELAGQTAVITGSGGGIGRAIALELAAAGANCLVHARFNRAGAEETALLAQRHGGQTHVVLCDLADVSARDELAQRAWAWREGVDIWINNAGADVLTGPAAGWSFEEKLDVLWRVDVGASIALGRAIGARMKAWGRGTIINIGWDQAESGMAGDSGQLFSATKGAVMAFSRSLARTLAPQVRVNCVAPGWIKTGWGQQASDDWQRRASGESLLERWGTPQDVAAAVRFLVSPAGAFINGQTVCVNGGWKPA